MWEQNDGKEQKSGVTTDTIEFIHFAIKICIVTTKILTKICICDTIIL